MRKKAIVKVVSLQKDIDDKAIEVVTPGEFYKEGNYFYAIYNETELSGMEGTRTTLKVSKEEFLLSRIGSTNGEMYFKKNSSDVSLYDTPYGALQLKIDTKELKVELDENGGEVYIDYNLTVANQEPQNTVLKVSIRV